MIVIKKGIIITILISFFTLGSIACTAEPPPKGNPPEPPEITVAVGDRKIEYVIGKNEWNGAKYDREDTFKTVLKKDTKIEIPYFEAGSRAEISFKNYHPEKFSVYDVLIDESGNQKYTDKEIITVPLEKKDDKYTFTIKKHLASALSSAYRENKIDFRGFRMIASWGRNECEYAFVIRTDGY